MLSLDHLKTGYIITIAGVGYTSGTIAKDTDIGWPMGVVRRPDGDLLFADIRAHRLWRIDRDGILHNFAGDGTPGNEGDNGPAHAARVYTPHDFYLDAEGHLFFSQLGARGPDEGPNTIRRIDAHSGIITTVFGSGRNGRGGEGLDALDAEFDTTCGVAVDAAGHIYACGKWDSNVRKVDRNSGLVSRVAGQTTRHYPQEVGHRRPYSGSHYSLAGFHGDGGPAIEAALKFPEHLAFNSKNDLYICDNGNNRIRKIAAHNGIISTVFGTGNAASNGDGGPAVEASTNVPDAIFIDAHDHLYIGEAGGCMLRKVDAHSGIVTTLAGTGIPGFGAEGLPGCETKANAIESGIWADPDGTVLYSDSSGRLRRIDAATGIVTTVAGGTHIGDGGPANRAFLACPWGLCNGPEGDIYFADSQNDRVRAINPHTGAIRTIAGDGGRGYGGDNGPATAAFFLNPCGIVFDTQGRLIIADFYGGRIRRVELDGRIHTLCGAGDGTDRGDGGPARSAGIITPYALACGPNGDIYIGDAAGRIRAIDAHTEYIRTVAGTGIPGWSGDGGPATQARIGIAAGIDFDNEGNLYFADLSQNRIRRIDRNGRIDTLAGSGLVGCSPDGTPSHQAKLHRPNGLAVSPDGTVYCADSRNNRVLYLAADGTIQTLAGSTYAGDSGNQNLAHHAQLNEPRGLCFYSSNILLISDYYNNRIKAVKL